jgi:hypothetical protein
MKQRGEGLMEDGGTLGMTKTRKNQCVLTYVKIHRKV